MKWANRKSICNSATFTAVYGKFQCSIIKFVYKKITSKVGGFDNFPKYFYLMLLTGYTVINRQL